jgi:molybdenum cofactor cytidylyltransferase
LLGQNSMTVACTVLTPGAAVGLDAPERFIHFHEPESLVHWAAQCACGSRCSRVSVVAGAHAEQVIASVADLPIEIIRGFDGNEGQAAAIRAATLWAIDRSSAALLLCSADQPFLTTRHLNALWYASEHGTRLVASYYSGRAGVPAVFPERHFGSLLALRGDEGADVALRRMSGAVCVAWPEGAIEVDEGSTDSASAH